MPTTVVETVRRKTDAQCHATRCRDGGCSLSLKDVPEPNVLISLEHLASPVNINQAHCDYLFVGGKDDNDGPWVAPIELTASKKGASEFQRQLQGGANIADNLLPQKIRVRFRPIAVHDGGLHRAEVGKLRKNKVRFRGKPELIHLMRCRSPLTQALRG